MDEMEKTKCIMNAACAKLYNLNTAIKFLKYWQSREDSEMKDITVEYAQREVDKLKKGADDFCNRFSNYGFPEIAQLRILLYH